MGVALLVSFRACLLANDGARKTAIPRRRAFLVTLAKLNGLEPRFYLRVAVRAGLRHETVPLPHEVEAMLADGKLDAAEFDSDTEGILTAAVAAALAGRTA